MPATSISPISQAMSSLIAEDAAGRKVFVIGWMKTGTTSIKRALEILGYRMLEDTVGLIDWARGEVDAALARLADYDGAKDYPWTLLYRELDRRFPGSRFILTEREPADWMQSLRDHAERTGPTHARDLVYGRSMPWQAPAEHLLQYLRHNQEVTAYFADRPGDLLVLPMGSKFGWQGLCGFLGLPEPEQPFPVENVGRRRLVQRVATIATQAYFPLAQRLALSLMRNMPSAHLTIFHDGSGAFRRLDIPGAVTCLPFPAIARLGAKRAKFVLYEAMIAGGDFLFLDADIVVVADIGGLFGHKNLAACPDDLSHCDFISDPMLPWPQLPSLAAKTYINSGVVFFPGKLQSAVQEMRRLAEDDAAWQQRIMPNYLYDNHFLCAQLNERRMPITRLEALEFNWQGFRWHGATQVRRRGDKLVNISDPAKQLRLVHFAGIPDPVRHLARLPLHVAGLIAQHATADGASADDPVLLSLARHGKSAPARVDEVELHAAYQTLLEPHKDAGEEFNDALLWNGVRCGPPYPAAPLCHFLRELTTRLDIKTIDAGLAPVYMPVAERLGLQQDGEGRRLIVLRNEGLVENGRQALQNNPAALLLVSATSGNYSTLLQAQQLLHLRLIAHLSLPGEEIVVLVGPQVDLAPLPDGGAASDFIFTAPRHVLRAVQPPAVLQPGAVYQLLVDIENQSDRAYSSNMVKPILLGYHWLDQAGNMVVFEGRRTRLPCTLLPGDRLRTTMECVAPAAPGTYIQALDVLQERHAWFGSLREDLLARITVKVG